MCRIFKYSSQDSSRLDVAAKFIFQSSRYVVPTGRVVVPAGRYVVPAGKVIIVSPGRLSLVPTGRVLSPGRVKELFQDKAVKIYLEWDLTEYTELTPAEAIQADCDIKAINIILQGLPTEIYAFVSQHRVANDL
ncbi:hypothetical protein Tco_1416935 [Tanacetum coccineum]